MTFREMNLRVFQGEPIPHVLFQPRIEPWYEWHRTFDCMPERYRGMSLLDLFDDLDVSMRYVHYYTAQPDPVVHSFEPRVRVSAHFGETEGVQAYETPYGELAESYRKTPDETWRKVGFPVKTIDDLVRLRWLYQHTHYSFSLKHFEQGSAFVGDRGQPQFWVPKSPYQALAQVWMKLDDLIYALADEPGLVAEVMQAIDDSYDPLYEQLIESGVVRIINFGENIHDHLLSPRYFERYLIPFWTRRADQLRAGGIYTHMHLDGYFRSLLPYLKELPFDGLEALTPVPQGDVALEEMKEHLGDKVLLDGIPAVCFLPNYPREQLQAMVEKIVDLFHPRLVLGVSDEVPEGAGEEAMERVRSIAQWCRTATGAG